MTDSIAKPAVERRHRETLLARTDRSGECWSCRIVLEPPWNERRPNPPTKWGRNRKA